jgi:hypothetical protein
METIEISHCRLESGIIGIKHLPKLKEISLRWNCEVARLGQLLEEVKANPNRPVLLLYNDPSKHDLGDTQEGSGTPVEANEPPKNVGESSQSNQGEDDDDDQQQVSTAWDVLLVFLLCCVSFFFSYTHNSSILFVAYHINRDHACRCRPRCL